MRINWHQLAGRTALLAALAVAGNVALGDELKSLTVCADPGNMPLSSQKGEGFENKIAQVVGAALGTGVQYYWRPSIERGLMRTTLSAGNCDLWMDMAADTEGAVLLTPLYRSTFVLVYRSDRGIHIKNLDDPALKRLRVGVFQVSAMREALVEHHLDHLVIHYVSHNADIEQNNQPSYQVQQVIDGTLDVAAVWGPMAGYYKSVVHAPLTIQPVNLMENQVPMEFDMALAVPRGRPDIKTAVETALVQHRAEIDQILSEYGVPLVRCEKCIVQGNLPSHGPYQEVVQPPARSAAQIKEERARRMAELKKWLAEGASPDDELNNAVTADDLDRVAYLLKHGAHADALDGEGRAALVNATRFGFADLTGYFIDHGADPNVADRSGWTPLMCAAWVDNPSLTTLLVRHGAKLEARDQDGLTALGIAAQNGKALSAEALVAAGADVNAPIAKGGYTPLMLASISGSTELVQTLLAHGAMVNAKNPGGVTALMIAAANNHSGIAALLLKSGAELDARSQDGRTALSIAQAANSEAVVKLLQQAAQRAGASKAG